MARKKNNFTARGNRKGYHKNKNMLAHLKRLNAGDGSNGQALMVIVSILELLFARDFVTKGRRLDACILGGLGDSTVHDGFVATAVKTRLHILQSALVRVICLLPRLIQHVIDLIGSSDSKGK